MRASGIAFCGATKESVVLRFDTDSARNFLLKDCLWVENQAHVYSESTMLLEKVHLHNQLTAFERIVVATDARVMT